MKKVIDIIIKALCYALAAGLGAGGTYSLMS